MDPIIYFIVAALIAMGVAIFLIELNDISGDIKRIRVSVTKNDCTCVCHESEKEQ